LRLWPTCTLLLWQIIFVHSYTLFGWICWVKKRNGLLPLPLCLYLRSPSPSSVIDLLWLSAVDRSPAILALSLLSNLASYRTYLHCCHFLHLWSLLPSPICFDCLLLHRAPLSTESGSVVSYWTRHLWYLPSLLPSPWFSVAVAFSNLFRVSGVECSSATELGVLQNVCCLIRLTVVCTNDQLNNSGGNGR
jgi:hypothetical protein